MDEAKKFVVTAIRDMNQESFVAATLSQLGWIVIYRATSLEGLKAFIGGESQVVVIASDDFRGIETLQFLALIIIRGKSQLVSSPADLNPVTAQDLQMIMQAQLHDVTRSELRIQPFAGKLEAFGSIGRGVGLSTIALNVAHEYSLNGEQICLIDCNLENPFFAKYLQLNGIRDGAQKTRYGFSVSEIDSPKSFQSLVTSSSHSDYLIVDLGQLLISSRTSIGRRLRDLTLTWVIQSMNALHLATRNNADDFRELRRVLTEIRVLSPQVPIHHIITLDEAVGRRDREKIAVSAREVTGLDVSIFSRDKKSVATAAMARAPLEPSTPKSLLRNEIVHHLDDAPKRINLLSRESWLG